MGWSRGKVADYSLLENLCPNCWALIVADFSKIAIRPEKEGATNFVATATLTENILRQLRPLTECHQLQIVQDLIDGKIKNGETWEIIGATFQNIAPNTQNRSAPQNGAVAPISEGLLRSITCLQPDHQFELVSDLIIPARRPKEGA